MVLQHLYCLMAIEMDTLIFGLRMHGVACIFNRGISYRLIAALMISSLIHASH